MDRPAGARPLRGTAPLLRVGALLRGNLAADTVGATPRTRGRGSRRTAQLRREPAARRVRADGEGCCAAPDHRGDAPLRARVSDARVAHSGSAHTFASSTIVAAESAMS